MSSNGDGCDNYRDIWSRCPPSTTEPRPPRSRALMQAVAAEATVVEGERLLDWKRIEQSAALSIADNQAERAKAKIVGPSILAPTTYVQALKSGDVIYCALRCGFQPSPARS